MRHPVAGTYDFPGFPWKFERTTPATWRHAPLFAEHNDEIFRDVLHLDSDEIATLYETGVTASEPVFSAGPSL